MTAPTVEIAGVSKSFGALHAVSDVSLALRPGERVALVGHNGAGKSTLIKMIVGLARPSAGSIAVLGGDPAGSRAIELRRKLGFLPENVVLPPMMTGREVLDFYARLKRRPVRENAELLDRVGLTEAAGRRVATYSKGMRQRLGLAQALLGKPRLLVLDEATTGLDPASRHSFYEIIAALREAGATVLLSSHALNEIADRTDRIAVMNRGRLVACGTLAELRALADLPVRIRIHLAPDTPVAILSSFTWTRLDERRHELVCANRTKLEALRHASSMDAVTDIEVMPPSLDDIYAHLMREAAE
jgi:Cu-processing system ATP-binding protein